MKINIKNSHFAKIVLLTALIIASCSKDEAPVEDEIVAAEVITATELKYSDESEMISEEVTTIAEDI